MMETKQNLSDILDANLNIRQEEKAYDRSDILNLFNSYLDGKIDESFFENNYYLMYTKDGATNISNEEKFILDNLGEVIHRFSPYPEDHALDSKAFVTKEEARKAIIMAIDKINDLYAGQIEF